jgi:hypothetical protein
MHQSPRPTRPAAALRSPLPTGRRGSALVLSIVTLIMLMMLGAAYLQLARTDRRTSEAVDTRSNVSEASILRYIGGILAGDVPQNVDTDAPEYFDYPWTNPDTIDTRNQWIVPDRFAPTVVPGPVPDLDDGHLPAREPRADTAVPDDAGRTLAVGGFGDDTWLASIEPDFGTGNWPHITNLMGVFLDLGDIDVAHDLTPAPVNPMPAQYLATADANLNSGVIDAVPALPTGDPGANPALFADATGDGIQDARWTWAPLPGDGGNAYVMAVRIIDNSALIDINTWAWDRLSGLPSRWYWPGDLDLESAMQGVTTAAGGGAALDAQDLLNDRGVTGTAFDYNDFLYNWLDAGAVPRDVNGNDDLDDWDEIGTEAEKNDIFGPGVGVENPVDPGENYTRYNARIDELELRWRGGLNRADDNVNPNPATDLENLDPALFREAAPVGETVYTQSGYGTPFDVIPFFSDEPRKQLTTISGSASAGSTNLNTAGAGNLSAAFRDAIDADDRQPTLMVNLGLADRDNFSDQLAAITLDFRDDDSELTERDGMFGMELLPFISEVYVQFRYDTPSLTVSPDNVAPHELEWPDEPEDFAAAIELVNPFPYRIEVPEIELFVGNEAWGLLTDLMPGVDFFEPNEMIVLTHKDAFAAANSELPNGGDTGGTAGPGGTGTRVIEITDDVDWPVATAPGAELINIFMVSRSTNGTIEYQRFVTNAAEESGVQEFNADPTVDPVDVAPPAVPARGYMQFRTQATATGYSPMMVVAGAGEPGREIDSNLEPIPADAYGANTLPLTPAVLRYAPDNPIAITGTFHAPSKGDAALDSRNDGTAADDWIIGNAGRFFRTGELLRMVCVGPRRSGVDLLTVPQVWREIFNATGNYDLQSARLTLDDPVGVHSAAGNRLSGINHAMFYLTRFTTLKTNNGEGGLVAGRPNINTMPLRHLENILPTINPATGATLAADIETERESNADDPSRKGIAFVSKLADPAVSTNIYDSGGNTSAAVADFNEVDPGVGGADPSHGLDGRTDDVEERTMLMNYLNQVVSTRSDIFTAYVLVRAYPSNDFSIGGPANNVDADGDGVADPLNAFRLIAVFDRSRVTGGLPRILAVKRIEVLP